MQCNRGAKRASYRVDCGGWLNCGRLCLNVGFSAGRNGFVSVFSFDPQAVSALKSSITISDLDGRIEAVRLLCIRVPTGGTDRRLRSTELEVVRGLVGEAVWRRSITY